MLLDLSTFSNICSKIGWIAWLSTFPKGVVTGNKSNHQFVKLHNTLFITKGKFYFWGTKQSLDFSNRSIFILSAFCSGSFLTYRIITFSESLYIVLSWLQMLKMSMIILPTNFHIFMSTFNFRKWSVGILTCLLYGSFFSSKS